VVWEAERPSQEQEAPFRGQERCRETEAVTAVGSSRRELKEGEGCWSEKFAPCASGWERGGCAPGADVAPTQRRCVAPSRRLRRHRACPSCDS
jgi:hypothetical protein